MDALKELWWVTVIIGVPALIAVLWQHHEDKKRMKEMEAFERFVKYMRLVQQVRDQINMHKIEEARNDFS